MAQCSALHSSPSLSRGLRLRASARGAVGAILRAPDNRRCQHGFLQGGVEESAFLEGCWGTCGVTSEGWSSMR